jgi:hypothetical protein
MAFIAPLNNQLAEYIPVRRIPIKMFNLFNTEVPKPIYHSNFLPEHRANNQNDIFERAKQAALNIRPRRREKVGGERRKST